MMKLRVVVTDANIQVLELEAAPLSVDVLKDLIANKCNVSANDITAIQ